jgi:hypothetical protein
MGSSAAAAASNINVKVRDLAGNERDFVLQSGATVADLLNRIVDSGFLGDTNAGRLVLTDMNNMGAGRLARASPLNDDGYYNVMQVSYQPGDLLRIYGPAQNQVQYFNPPDPDNNNAVTPIV